MERRPREILAEPLAVLGLPARTLHALEKQGIFKVVDLLMCCPRASKQCSCPHKHLLDIPNFGVKTLEQVFVCLEEHGFVREGKRRGSRKNGRPGPGSGRAG